MGNISIRVADRLRNGIKRFQPILSSALSRDVNESDTVIIVTDILAEVFGYDKYSELTSENAIRGTYCDLATKLDGVIQCLIEAKAIGQELKDTYVKQAVDYAANKGVDWVVLTNGVIWRVYKVIFNKPIDQELTAEINLLTVDTKADAQLELVYLLTKEAWSKSALGDFYLQKQALSRFCIAAMVLSEPVLGVIRRELRRMSPDIKIEVEQIQHVLENEVFKRDVLEGDKADEARRKISRSVNRAKTRGQREEPTEKQEAPSGQPEANATPPPLANPPMPSIVPPPSPAT